MNKLQIIAIKIKTYFKTKKFFLIFNLNNILSYDITFNKTFFYILLIL